VSITNSLVMASTRPLSGAAIQRAPLSAELRLLAFGVGARLAPALSGGAVYTDDRAPVEWLTDLAILRYATGAH
jgi:hypothetical protein